MNEEDEHLRALLLDDLWFQWCRTKDINCLKLFIRRGGNIDDHETRDLIADLIEKKNPGGAMPMEAIRFYNHVNMLVDVKGMNKTTAVEFIAKQEGISNGWDRYERGEELEKDKY